MRLPDPIANTTTEAYLAYKAGVLAEGDLKPKLYEPYIHLDAWLAYWAGLTTTYPVKGVGKNLFNIGTNLDDYFLTVFNGLNISPIEVSDRVSATISGGTLEIGSYNQANWCWLSKWVEIPKNTKITVSAGRHMNLKIVGFNNGSNNGTELLYVLSGDYEGSFDSGNYDRYAISLYPHSAGSVFENIQIELGSTATAYEPYTGEPEMLTDEEAFIAYLSGVTDTYPEEFRDPADIRVAAYLRYLISARWGRPEYPVTNEELYLSMLKTKYIPSGDPSSDITIDGTAKAPFVDVKMYGDTYQQSYTGKNLIYPNLRSSGTYLNGLTPSYNDATGEITITGTPTESWSNIGANTNISLPAGTYTLSQIGASATHSVAMYVNHSDNTRTQLYIAPGGSSATVNIAKDIVSYYVYVSQMAIGEQINDTYKMQLEAGSTVTAFEPYVGGHPSPSPDYPQQIQTVTGEQTVEVQGKNLFDKSDQSILRNRRISTSTGGTYGENGWSISPLIKVIPGETYTVGGVGQTSYYCLFKDGRYISGSGLPSNSHLTIPFGANQFKFDYPTANEAQIQLELGSTASAYTPYSSTDYPISLGTIELCKLGTYQDYIWKDGDDWKVHKATSKYVYNNDLGENGIGSTYVAMLTPTLPTLPNMAFTDGLFWCNSYTPTMRNNTGLQGSNASGKIRVNTSLNIASSYAQVRALAAANNLTIHYPLATAIDTVITDQNLIAQLDALVNGGAENGTTYIKVNATDPNLPGLLYVEAPKYE